MQQWIIYGLIASFFFGANIIVYKVAATRGIGLNPYLGGLAYAVGIFLLFLTAYLLNPSFTNNWKGLSLSLIAGIMWALGSLAVIVAISKKGDIARLAPLYNTNTLIAVLLGIIFLKEIPDASGIFKIISGAVLITIGAILVTI